MNLYAPNSSQITSGTIFKLMLHFCSNKKDISKTEKTNARDARIPVPHIMGIPELEWLFPCNVQIIPRGAHLYAPSMDKSMDKRYCS